MNLREKHQFLLFHLFMLCIHWLIIVCALTGIKPVILALWGEHSNQLSYSDKTITVFLKKESKVVYYIQLCT